MIGGPENRNSHPASPDSGARSLGPDHDGVEAPGTLARAETHPRPAETTTSRTETENTRRAYANDWAAFGRWCRLRGASPLPPDPELIGLYLADCAAPRGTAAPLSVASIERRLSGLRWAYRHRGLALARDGGQIADILAAIRRAHGAPPDSKAPLSAQDLLAMVATLPYDLRGLRDRALLLLGFAAGTRRSQIVGLDCAPNDTTGQAGWIEIEPRGALLVLKDKTGWREVEVGRGSNDRSCPVRALESWLSYAKIDTGPVFRRVSRDGRRPLAARLSDKHVARLIKRTVLASGIRSDLPEAERLRLYSGHSLRGDLAGSTEDGARRLGHAATGMAGEGRSDERYRVNRTKASGL